MRKLSIVLIAILIVFGGCAQKKVVTKPTEEIKAEPKKEAAPTTTTVAPEERPATEPQKPAEEKVEEKVVEEKVVEEKIAVTEKKADVAPVEPAPQGKRFISEAPSSCSPDQGGDIVFSSVYFDFDSYMIRQDAASTLKELSSYLSKNNITLTIEGHADERGTTEYNLALSQKRASSVEQYLIQSGIPSKKLEIVSCGEEQPVCTEKTEECWAKNRRAHFVIIKNDKISQK